MTAQDYDTPTFNQTYQFYRYINANPASALATQFVDTLAAAQSQDSVEAAEAEINGFFSKTGSYSAVTVDSFLDLSSWLFSKLTAWASFAQHFTYHLFIAGANGAEGAGKVIFSQTQDSDYSVTYLAADGSKTPLYYQAAQLVDDLTADNPAVRLQTSFAALGLFTGNPADSETPVSVLCGTVHGQQSLALPEDNNGNGQKQSNSLTVAEIVVLVILGVGTFIGLVYLIWKGFSALWNNGMQRRLHEQERQLLEANSSSEKKNDRGEGEPEKNEGERRVLDFVRRKEDLMQFGKNTVKARNVLVEDGYYRRLEIDNPHPIDIEYYTNRYFANLDTPEGIKAFADFYNHPETKMAITRVTDKMTAMKNIERFTVQIRKEYTAKYGAIQLNELMDYVDTELMQLLEYDYFDPTAADEALNKFNEKLASMNTNKDSIIEQFKQNAEQISLVEQVQKNTGKLFQQPQPNNLNDIKQGQHDYEQGQMQLLNTEQKEALSAELNAQSKMETSMAQQGISDKNLQEEAQQTQQEQHQLSKINLTAPIASKSLDQLSGAVNVNQENLNTTVNADDAKYSKNTQQQIENDQQIIVKAEQQDNNVQNYRDETQAEA